MRLKVKRTHYRKNENIIFEHLENDGAILLDSVREITFIMNETAYIIWNHIEYENELEIAHELYSNMNNREDFLFDEVYNYVVSFVESLIKNELVTCQ